MPSLSEAYRGSVRGVVSRRRRALAVAFFAAGVVMSGVAILLTTTGLRSVAGLGVVEAREVAGVLAGLGLPAAVLGIFAALPASDETRAAATIGASVAVFGVLLFVYAYPSRWLSTDPALTVGTVAIYTFGTLVAFWCLFVAVATFNRRNDPGGTARVEVTDEETIRLVSRDTAAETPSPEQQSATPGLGGVGMVGSGPDGDVPTQTNNSTNTAQTAPVDTTADDGRAQHDGSPAPTSDGGAVTRDGGSVPAEQTASADTATAHPDVYCGNCAQFEYVEVGGDLDPYCGYHQEFMDDLEPCDRWTANTSDEPQR